MKKVGILTFHYADNYGAVLQTWALMQILNSMENVNAEIINYVPENYTIYPYKKTSDEVFKMKEKRHLYEQFLVNECKVNSPMIHRVNGEGYDYCCVGSDQVWNMNLRENVNKEYLLPNIGKTKHFSYAASIGGGIIDEDKKYFQTMLSTFSNISVREELSEKELRKLGINNVETSIDPTLLLEAEEYNKLVIEPKNPPKDFLFFFSYPIGSDLNKYASFANHLAWKYDLCIKHSIAQCPSMLFFRDQGTMIYEGIGEFLWYMKNASIVVTTSYHGAIFGNLFNRPTFVVCRENGKERFLQLKRVLGINSHFVDEAWISKKWTIEDGFCTRKELPKWRQKSTDYLMRCLDE